MLFTLYMPYQSSMVDSEESSEGFYATEEDYVNALRQEEMNNGMVVYNAMSNGNFDISEYKPTINVEVKSSDSIAYTKSDCTLYSPNGAIPESVDTMIDKFVVQKEFLIMVNFNMSSMESEFEEELRQWNKETSSILKYRQKMGDEWLNNNIPKRDLKISFLNKSNKLVNFILENSEIEEKIANNRYLIYVNKMKMLK